MILRRAAKLLLALLSVLVGLLMLLWVLAVVRERDDDVPPGIRLVPTSYGRVAVAERGPIGGPPVLLIHGSAGWSGFWRETSGHLAARGWRVIAADIPPFGYSDRDPAGRYDRVSQARRLSELLRGATAGRPATVVAHSLGRARGRSWRWSTPKPSPRWCWSILRWASATRRRKARARWGSAR